jgi:hypothetical protein
MRRHPLLSALSIAALFICAPADALCYYNGKFDAQTTILQEFDDSKWVVRARAIAAVDCWGDRCNDADAPYTVYRLKVLHSYKGNAPSQLKFFTERNSGGFYMDRPWVKLPKGHDIGGEYLLFLVPSTWPASHRSAKNSVFVNYSCGQSKSWREVPRSSRLLLEQLSRTNHRPRT